MVFLISDSTLAELARDSTLDLGAVCNGPGNLSIA